MCWYRVRVGTDVQRRVGAGEPSLGCCIYITVHLERAGMEHTSMSGSGRDPVPQFYTVDVSVR